jgi:hypothetical protein
MLDDSSSLALTLVRTGPKLEAQCCEDFVLELSPGGRSYWATRCVPPDIGEGLDEQSAGVPHIEDDLFVEDIDFFAEPAEHCGECLIVQSPVPSKARKLMEARTRQCIICLAEKEHTLVPPHLGSSHKQVESHRFCTDCFGKFLKHQLKQAQNSSSRKPPSLSCPICRSPIDAPDVWKVVFEMPNAGRRRSQLPQRTLGTKSAESLDASAFWASKRVSAEDALPVQDHVEIAAPCDLELDFPVSSTEHRDKGGVLALVCSLLQWCVPWCQITTLSTTHAKINL